MIIYDTGNRKITGVSQHQGENEGDIHFASPDGDVALGSLKVAD